MIIVLKIKLDVNDGKDVSLAERYFSYYRNLLKDIKIIEVDERGNFNELR